MKYDQIKVGSKIKLTPKNSNDYNKRFYESKVAQIYENRRLFEMETPLNCVSLYEKGLIFEFVFFTGSGSFTCDCILVRTYMAKKRFHTTVRCISPVVAADLRLFPRYKMSLPLVYSVIGDKESFMDDSGRLYEGLIQDLSGGGVRFLGREAVDIGSKLRIMIEKKEGSLLAEGVVVGIREFDGNDGLLNYEIRARFVQTRSSNRKRQRVKCSLKCKYTLLFESEDPYMDAKKPGHEYYIGEIKNISERGLRLAGSAEINPGAHLYLEFENNGVGIAAECAVVSKLATGSKGEYENGVKFISTRAMNGNK